MVTGCSIGGICLYYRVALPISDWLEIFTVLVFLESIWATVLIFLLREGRREKRERRRNLEGYLEKHSRVLVNEVLKKWFESEVSDIAFIGDHEFVYSTPLAKAYYKPHFKSRVQEPTEPQLKYVDQAIEHLERGYADVWNLWLECKNLVKNHLEKAVKIWESIEKTVVKKVPTKFIEWDAKGVRPPTCYILDNMVWEIYTKAQHFIATRRLEPFRIIPEKDYFRVDVATLYAKSPDEGLLKELTNIIDAIIRDENLLKQVKSLDEEKALIENEAKEFQVTLDKIIDDFENGHINLEGSCWRCKPWHDELASLR